MLALGAAACGGDDESTTTGDTPAGDTTSPAGGSGAPDKNGSAAKDDGGAARKPAGGTGGSGSADVDAAPLRVSGGGSPQFRVKGGDNSIQSWGEESEGAQLEAAAEAVHGFYVARANLEWAAACSYLAKSMVKQLRQFATQTKQAGNVDCATLLEALTPPLAPNVRRESTIVDAGSLRVGEEHSFLIYRGEEGTVYAMPLEDEDGAWKLTLLSPTPLG